MSFNLCSNRYIHTKYCENTKKGSIIKMSYWGTAKQGGTNLTLNLFTINYYVLRQEGKKNPYLISAIH